MIKHQRQFILYSQSFICTRLHEKENDRLVLVTTAGSATTSSLELSALGADVGPDKKMKEG